MKIKNKDILKKGNGEYCPKCYSKDVKRIDKGFYCKKCGASSERLIIIDDKINYWIDDHNNYWHESVGILIENKKREILLIKLDKFPFGYSIPAGHVDNGENPIDAAKRETLEEVGLDLDNFDLMLDADLTNDPCRRGADHHRWHLYKVRINNANVRINEESSNSIWINPKNALELKLTSPARHFLSGLEE